VASVDIIDKYIVQLTLTSPFSGLLSALFNVLIAPKEVKSRPLDFLKNTANGTGPWMLDSWKPNVEMKLVRNPNYWGTINSNITGITIRIMPEESSIIAALRTGEVLHARDLRTGQHRRRCAPPRRVRGRCRPESMCANLCQHYCPIAWRSIVIRRMLRIAFPNRGVHVDVELLEGQARWRFCRVCTHASPPAPRRWLPPGARLAATSAEQAYRALVALSG
jgi:Bacterial extracellular solute-binding proteins, family 5 Middle